MCYVHLKDIDLDHTPAPSIDIGQDEWFERAWTLQELVAPTNVKYYDRNWRYIGDKYGLKQQIHERTGISTSLLEDKANLEDFSIAECMSWAAGRKGTIVEDRAYSLFGLFGINLPMLYSEREKAFLRLQEGIIKTSVDHSIFASVGMGDRYRGLLARTPEDFAGCGSVKIVRPKKGRSAYTMTNRGVEITLNLTLWTLDTYLARIHCNAPVSLPNSAPVEGNVSGIFLKRLDEGDQYARVSVDGEEVKSNVKPALGWESSGRDAYSRDVSIYVRQPKATMPELVAVHTFGYRICSTLLRRNSKNEPLFKISGPPVLIWDDATRLVTISNGSGSRGWIATIDVWRQSKKLSQLKLCFDFEFNPVLFIAASCAVGGKSLANKNEAYRDSIDTLTKRVNILLSRAGTLSNTADTLLAKVATAGSNEWHYAPEEVNGSKSLDARTADDELGWSPISRTPEKGRVASQSPHRQGLWAVKGDHVDGLDVILKFDDALVAITKVKFQKVKTYHGLVWDLKIDNVPG